MKNRKLIIVIVISVILLISLTLFVYVRYQDYQRRMSLVSQVVQTPEVSEEMAIWTDQSGFSVEYPKNLIMNPHDEDNENYAHVELTSATYSGSLIVWAKDTTVVNIEDYAKKSKALSFIDTTLGGESAKKLLQTDVSKKITTSVIKDGYLYQIEADLKDNEYWNKIFDKVSASFRFKTNELKKEENNTPASSNEETSGGDSGGDEEVIE